MSKLKEVRKALEMQIIKVTENLYLKIGTYGFGLYSDEFCQNQCNAIRDEEIEPFIKALQDLIK